MIKIPLMLEDGSIVYLEFFASKFGDPYSVTVVIPTRLNGTISLSRSMFSDEMKNLFSDRLDKRSNIGVPQQ